MDGNIDCLLAGMEVSPGPERVDAEREDWKAKVSPGQVRRRTET